jgi:GT2 family glycosyltransferase/glycosyltransferase involved in cell wall biosynthesis
LETIAEPSRVCAYFRRDAWNEAGADLPRAQQLGWQHVAAGGVFATADIAHDVTQPTRLYASVAPSDSDVATLRCASGNTVWIGPRAYQLPDDRAALLDALRGVKRLRVNTAVNVPAELFALGIPYEIRVDDYSWICPRTNLVDATGRYCGEPAIAACERCYQDLGAREDWSDPGFVTVEELRTRSSEIFARAQEIVFPSRDVQRRMARYCGAGAGRVEEARSASGANGVRAGSVATLGDEAILDASRYDAFKRGLPLVFSNGAGAAVLLYANPAPDTTAVVSTLPIVTFDIGATGEAVRTHGVGRVVPITATAAQINDVLLSLLPSSQSAVDDVVDIVMPVYSGVAETRTAIESVLASSVRQAYELIVVFDNPSYSAMREMLAEFAGRITVIENAENVGFVASVNRGMALHPGRDVLLLNSDIVAPCSDWLDRIRRAAYASSRIGTVTPFSNNATICSYPRFCRNNAIPEGWSVTGLDAHCRETLAGITLELPTTVGFCMYIRADCLAETGMFDAETFGQGYGEENDFCMRAASRGWEHVLAADVFVQHVGGVSFGAAASGRAAAAYEKLKSLHPQYGPAVERFLDEDPVLPLRRKLDLVRLKPREQAYCVASNKLPGGTERHVQEVSEAARARGEHVVVLRYGDGEHVEVEGFDNQRYRLPDELPALRVALRELGVARLHIHQTVDAPPALFDLGLPYEVTVHDYAWICPQIKLIDRTGQYCGEPAVHVCEACFAALGAHADWPSVTKRMSSVGELRAQSRQHLEGAERVFFPSHDAAQRMTKYADLASPVVRLHDERPPAARRWRRSGSEAARIVFIGGLTHAKGFDILHACAFDARKRGLPLEFTVAGACAEPRRLKDLGVRVLGPYLEDEIYGILSEIQPHIAFFPGQWPETFSYTLSIAFDAGVWPVAYDLGAIAERVKRNGYGRLVALDTPISEINDLLWNEA